MLIIMSDKVIARFESLLESSLLKAGFNSDETAKILRKANDGFRGIARANPLKPKSLPDTGLDVAGAINKAGKTAIILNPDILFEHHDLFVPVPPEDTKRLIEEKRTLNSPATKYKSYPEINIAEIIKAAKSVYQKNNLRPDVGEGIIQEGPLQGTRWMSLSSRITNDTNFRMTEGFKSLSQIFNIGMIGLKHKPLDPRKARETFEDVFNRAATHLGKRYTKSPIAKDKDDNPKRKLPFVFQMLEDSIVETSAFSGLKPNDSTIINKGPLSGMGLKIDDLQGFFTGARNRSSDFPFDSYSDFIADRNIWQKVSQKMEQRALEAK